MAASDEILTRHGELEAARALEEPKWRDLAYLFRPDDRDFHQQSSTRRDDDDLFDATGLYAVDAFAKGLFKQATNPVNRWFELGIADQDRQRFRPVSEWLLRRTEQLYASVSPAVSRFYVGARPWFASLGVFGCGALFQQENIAKGRIIDRQISIGQIYLDRDADGELDTVHRAFRLRGRQLKQLFPRHLPDHVRDDSDYKIVHAVRPNPDYRPELLGLRGMQYLSTYCSPDLKELCVNGGYHELPYHVLMWNEQAHSAYPTGPGHDARADGLNLQEQERSHLVAGQFAAEPPLLAQLDSGLTAADIAPNAWLPGAVNDQGKALIQTLDRKQNVALSLTQAEQKREAIRRAFYWSVMSLISRPQMTASEFQGFQQEMLEDLAPNLVNIQVFGLSPFIRRRYAILERAGAWDDDPPPPELDGQRLEIEYVSPLARAQKMGVARAAQQFAASVIALAESVPEALDNLDVDATVRVIHDGMSGVPSLVRDPRQVLSVRQARAQAQAQQVGIEQAATRAEIMATVSHAAQADTLAKQRGRR